MDKVEHNKPSLSASDLDSMKFRHFSLPLLQNPTREESSSEVAHSSAVRQLRVSCLGVRGRKKLTKQTSYVL